MPGLDEMVDGSGGLRPHWRGVLGAFTALEEGGLAERGRRLDRAFDEEGIASVLPGVAGRAWRCDPVPLPLPAAEFAALEAGLAQRARLLARLLDDIYGAQTVAAEGLLPPALVFANPGFLRPCRFALQAPLLHSYAADLIRAPDGAWHVLADRTAATGGAGYARENRRLLARVLPEALRPVQMRQLRPFFDIWQDSLRRLDPRGRPNPTVALLTPGTTAPQWFEHMYLARELSCALVEGGDLTVRGGAVFLKTLKGLQQVDVLLRRLDGRMIDPLELEAGSLLGVPGLIDVLRQGNVRIANDPGSGAVEAPALAAFLPALCRRLLGEELRLPGVPTLWLGEPAALAAVQSEPGQYRVMPAMDSTAAPVLPDALPAAARAELMARIAARPWEWAASRLLPPSVAPCLEDGRLAPRPIVLRLFLVHDGQAWRAMPGGLARIMEEREWLAGRAPALGVSKDVWVLSEDSNDIVGPPSLAVPALRLRRTAGDLPSRVADNLFWLGRYVERLDRAARLSRAALQRLVRVATLLPHEIMELEVLALCLAEARLVPKEGRTVTGLGEALLGSVRDGGAVAGLFTSVARLTENVRDRLTGEMYATFTASLRAARADTASAGRNLDRLAQGMVAVTRFAIAVAGVAAENMVRGGGWTFLELGRRVERAWAVAGEVAVALDQPPPRIEAGLRLVLELCNSAITYRSRYFDVLQPAPVLDLVLVDQGNPRGLAFQFAQMHTLLDEPGRRGGHPRAAGRQRRRAAGRGGDHRRCGAGRRRPGRRGVGLAAAAGGHGGRRGGAVGPHHATLFRPAARRADAGLVGRDGAGAEGGGVRYQARHVTTYTYGRPVDLASHMLHLTPRVLPGQTVLSASLRSAPMPSRVSAADDHFGNHTTWMFLDLPHQRFEVVVEAEVEVEFPAPPPPEATPPWEALAAALRAGAPGCWQAAEFVFEFPAGPGRPLRRPLRARELPAGPAGAGRAARPDRPHPARLHLPRRRHHHRHPGGAGAGAARRRLPGLHACDDRRAARARPVRALHVGLPAHAPAAQHAGTPRRRPVARLGRRLARPAVRLGGPRPHQRSGGARRTRGGGLGPRLQRHQPGPRRHPGRRRAHRGGGGRSGAGFRRGRDVGGEDQGNRIRLCPAERPRLGDKSNG